MQNGDISNVSPPTLLVTMDAVVDPSSSTKKILGLIPVSDDTFEWNLRALNQVWRLTDKYGCPAELVVFSKEQSEVDKYIEELDRLQANPFNGGVAYYDVDTLIRMLPYMFEAKYVIDIPTRVAMYGSRGVELDQL